MLRVGGRRSNFGIAPGSPTETRPAFRTIQVRPKDWWTPRRQAHDASNRLRPAVPTCYDRRRHLGGSPCPARGGGSSSHCSAVRRRLAAYGAGATAGDAARRLASQHTELLLRSAVPSMVLIMTSTSGLAQTRPPVALEHQEMVAKRAKEREKIENCQKQATEEKILPRDRPQFVVKCLDGATGPSQPSVVAPEYQELAAWRAKQKERVDNCQKQATEQKVLPRDRPQFVISCLEK